MSRGSRVAGGVWGWGREAHVGLQASAYVKTATFPLVEAESRVQAGTNCQGCGHRKAINWEY